MAGKVFWTVRRSKVVSRVQTNFIKTVQDADTPQECHGSIENIISMCLGAGSVTVAATDSGDWRGTYSAAADEESFGYFQRNLL